MEGFVEPEFHGQFNECRKPDYYDPWKPVVKFACNYCNPIDAGYKRMVKQIRMGK